MIGLLLLLLLLSAVTHAPFHASDSVLRPTSWPNARDRRDGEANYPRRARSALGVDTVLTLDVCLYVCMFVCLYVSALERKRLIGMT